MLITKKGKGFTLIELLVVIAVIGLLASIILVALNTSRKKARAARRLSDLSQARLVMDLYFDYYGAYASSLAFWSFIGTDGWISYCQCWGGFDEGYVPSKFQRFIGIIPNDPTMDKNACTSCYIYKSDGIDYKIVDYQVSEFSAEDYLARPESIDPALDGGADPCVVDGSDPTGWAVYSPGAACWTVFPL